MSEIYLPKLIDKISDFVPGLKANWQDYEAHKAATEADNVHGLQDLVAALTGLFGMEIGQNENGSWVRWNIGLQVCWNHFGTVSDLVTNSSTYDGITTYRCDIPVVFPVEFSENPAVVPTGNPRNHADMDTNITAVSTTGTNLRIHSQTDFEEVLALGYIAVGWWKTPDDPAEWSGE